MLWSFLLFRVNAGGEVIYIDTTAANVLIKTVEGHTSNWNLTIFSKNEMCLWPNDDDDNRDVSATAAAMAMTSMWLYSSIKFEESAE